MCGRFQLQLPFSELSAFYSIRPGINLQPRWNIAPTQDSLVVRLEAGGERVGSMLRWGLLPHWSKSLADGARAFNAMSETIAEKPTFRAAVRQRRCLVLASAWYEWTVAEKVRHPHQIERIDGAPIAFAGLWERWTPPPEPGETGDPLTVETFTIATTVAANDIAHLHKRMPVVLESDAECATWLDPDPARFGEQLALLKPLPVGRLRAFRVSHAIGNWRNEGAEAAAPLNPA